VEDPLFKEAPSLSQEDQLLIDLYLRSGLPADQLPYTDEFEYIYDQLRQAGDTRSKQAVYLRLLNLRKSGRLPRVA